MMEVLKTLDTGNQMLLPSTSTTNMYTSQFEKNHQVYCKLEFSIIMVD